MDMDFWLSFLKFLHLGGLILWLGPSGGAWLLIQLAKRRLDQHDPAYADLYHDFVRFFPVEHFGLFLLLGSGVGMLALYGWSALEWSWLLWKLGLVLGIIIPIEIGDIWYGHVRLPRLFGSRTRDAEIREDRNPLDAYERRFVPATLPVLLAAVVVIMALAVFKPL